jgi:hypothetical protein
MDQKCRFLFAASKRGTLSVLDLNGGGMLNEAFSGSGFDIAYDLRLAMPICQGDSFTNRHSENLIQGSADDPENRASWKALTVRPLTIATRCMYGARTWKNPSL